MAASIDEFGAAADGSRDVSAAIDAAIKRMIEYGVSAETPGALYFPPGT